jgi:hypothetical protein
MHECPECAADCTCLPGDILERNCIHCDDLDENFDDVEDPEAIPDDDELEGLRGC